MNGTTVGVGVLGCGTVGSALCRLVAEHGDTIAARSGVRLHIARVAVHNLARDRPVTFPDGVLTHDADELVADPDVEVVVELMGGMEPARRLIHTALEAGKPVVTANKEVLANAGAELLEAAAKSGVDLLYEAAVAGAIPLIRPLRESLAGDRLVRVMGIVNGTTNFILTRMTESGQSFSEALAEAQDLGFAERDPSADVEGWDAAAKAAIIASVAFGTNVVAGDVYREGIASITADDIVMAGRLGYVVKLLAVVEAIGDGEVEGAAGPSEIAVRVHPAMIPVEHPLAVEEEQPVLRPPPGGEEEQRQLIGRQQLLLVEAERDLPITLGQMPGSSRAALPNRLLSRRGSPRWACAGPSSSSKRTSCRT